MKQSMRIAFGMALLLSAAHVSCNREKSTNAVEPCALLVQGTHIQYKGRSLPLPGSLADWEQVLGKHSRMLELSSGTYVWDDAGIYVATKRQSLELTAFTALLNHQGDGNPLRKAPKYFPRSTFKGRLCVDGNEITSASTVSDLNVNKEGLSFQRGYLDRIYSYKIFTTPADVYVRIDLTDEGTVETFAMEFSDHAPGK